MKKTIAGLLLLSVLLIFTGTGLAQEAEVAIVYGTGGLGDKSFNDAAHRGLQRAEEELNIEFSYAEPEAVAEYENYLSQFANAQRYDLIISLSFDQADALESIAPRFPDQKFVLIDAVVEQPNIASYVYNEKERGFLMGAIGAMMTTRTEDEMINEEKVIGVIGGMEIPLIEANVAGYMAGANYIDPEVEVLYSYVGSWTDPAKAKEMAISMYEDDADIVWGAAGRSGMGVIRAAEENDFYAMGADSDQGHVAPDHVLTNGMKYVDNTVYQAVEQVVNDEFEAGIHELGVAEKGLGYTDSLLPDDVLEKAEEIMEKVINDEVEIPETIEEVEK